jgi:hypothetical protein
MFFKYHIFTFFERFLSDEFRAFHSEYFEKVPYFFAMRCPSNIFEYK